MRDPDLTVQRIHTDHGSHIEPPLLQSWPDLKKLAWHAAVVKVDSGLELTVAEPRRGEFVVFGANRSSSNYYSFSEAWCVMVDYERGAQMFQAQLAG